MRFLPLLLLVLSNLLQAATFRVGVEYLEYYPAYNYIGKPSDASASKDILDDFAKKHGHTFEYVPLPVQRLYKDFLDGKLDFKFPDHPLWQGDMKSKYKLVYSDPVFEFIDGLVVRDPQLKSIDQIKTIGTFNGFTVHDYAQEIKDGKIELKTYNSFRELIMATLKKSVQGAYLNIKVADYYQDEIKKKYPELGTLSFQASLPHTSSSYHLSTLSHPKLLEDFNKYLKEHASFVKKVITERRVAL